MPLPLSSPEENMNAKLDDVNPVEKLEAESIEDVTKVDIPGESLEKRMAEKQDVSKSDMERQPLPDFIADVNGQVTNVMGAKTINENEETGIEGVMRDMYTGIENEIETEAQRNPVLQDYLDVYKSERKELFDLAGELEELKIDAMQKMTKLEKLINENNYLKEEIFNRGGSFEFETEERLRRQSFKTKMDRSLRNEKMEASESGNVSLLRVLVQIQDLRERHHLVTQKLNQEKELIESFDKTIKILERQKLKGVKVLRELLEQDDIRALNAGLDSAYSYLKHIGEDGLLKMYGFNFVEELNRNIYVLVDILESMFRKLDNVGLKVLEDRLNEDFGTMKVEDVMTLVSSSLKISELGSKSAKEAWIKAKKFLVRKRDSLYNIPEQYRDQIEKGFDLLDRLCMIYSGVEFQHAQEKLDIL
ncbi:hypothetical protein ACFL21_00635 [Patescibacteria group bacterium]